MTTKPTRKNLSKRTRFEVFKRDAFTCQYCGAKAPDVVLHVDHIQPVSAGGTNDLLNLVTACQGCNAGKSDKKLDDSSAIQKRRKQADLQAERLEQIKMMAEWAEALAREDNYVVAVAEGVFQDITGHTFSRDGERRILKAIREYGFEMILRAIRGSCETYIQYDGNVATDSSAALAFNKIPAVARSIIKYGIDRHEPKIAYAQGIIRNRLDNHNYNCFHEFMFLYSRGIMTADEIVDFAKGVTRPLDVDDIFLENGGSYD